MKNNLAEKWEPSLEDKCAYLLELKEQENIIKEQRIEVENDIAAIVATKEEGTDKAEVGSFKVTVTSKLTRSLDYPAYLAIENDIPAGLRCVDLKPTLNLKILRAMEMANPDIIPVFVTTKPAKSSVKVEVA